MVRCLLKVNNKIMFFDKIYAYFDKPQRIVILIGVMRFLHQIDFIADNMPIFVCVGTVQGNRVHFRNFAPMTLLKQCSEHALFRDYAPCLSRVR